MLNPRSSPSVQSGHYDSSNLSSFTSRSMQNIVPTGTVAARILLLHSLATPSSPNVPRPLVHRCGENSRTGFGRRASARFDKPASRVPVPVGQSDILPEHSFLGHRTPRAHYMEAHANESTRGRPDGLETRAQYDGTSRLLSQLNPGGLETRVQYDATSPWASISKSKSHNDIQIENGDQQQARDSTSHEHKSNHLDDRASVETTSSMRQQSVKDLYKEYGIRRPAGLLSSESLDPDSDGTFRPHRLCHICFRSNGSDGECWRCGHSLCQICDSLAPDRTSPQKKSAEYDNYVSPRILYSEHVPIDQIRSSESFAPKAESRQQDYIFKKRPKHISDEPELPRSNLPDQQHKSHRTERLLSSGFQQEILHPECTVMQGSSIDIVPPSAPSHPDVVPTGVSKLQYMVEHSPFLAADRRSPNHLEKIIPVAMKIMHRPFHQHNPTRSKVHRSSSIGENGLRKEFSCDSPEFQATHSGHRPYRHSTSCTQSRLRNSRDTENGHVASASHFEDHGILPGSNAKSDLGHSHAMIQTLYSTEYIECLGYPRSAYSDSAGLSSVDLVKECLHDLNDSKCERCPSTHHIDVSHRDEGHHAAERPHCSKISGSPGVQNVKASNSSTLQQQIVQRSERDVPKIRMIQVIMPKPRRKVYRPSWIMETHGPEADEDASQKITATNSKGSPHTLNMVSKSCSKVKAQGSPTEGNTKTKTLAEKTECLPKAARPKSTVASDQNPIHPPMRFGRSTLAELKAKWEEECAAASKEKSRSLRPTAPEKKICKGKVTPTKCFSTVEQEAALSQPLCSEFSLEPTVNTRKTATERTTYSYDMSVRHPLAAPPLRPNLSKVPVLRSVSSQSPVGVRRLSALFDSQGNKAIPVFNQTLPEQRDEIRPSETIREKSSVERDKMQAKQATQQEKSTRQVLNKELFRQQEEVQKVDGRQLTSCKNRFSKEGEGKPRLETFDESSGKRRKPQSTNLSSCDTETLDCENHAIVGAAKHVISHNRVQKGLQDSVVFNDTHKPNSRASIREMSFRPRKPHGTEIKHGGWATVVIGDVNTQYRSEREVADKENECFEFAEMGIKGISIVIHLEDREDLVIEADLGRD